MFIIIGIVCGLLGALFNSLNRRLTLFRARFVNTRRKKFLEAIVVAALTALLCCLLPLLLPCTSPVFDGHTVEQRDCNATAALDNQLQAEPG